MTNLKPDGKNDPGIYIGNSQSKGIPFSDKRGEKKR